MVAPATQEEVAAAQAVTGYGPPCIWGTWDNPAPWTVIAKLRGARFAASGPKCAADYSKATMALEALAAAHGRADAWAWALECLKLGSLVGASRDGS